ncbi:MAG: hypothetical protein SGJ19_05115 [Planctomycetia bacterium]|nr:hypothetical protein [Planctomycetia bacterium]
MIGGRLRLQNADRIARVGDPSDELKRRITSRAFGASMSGLEHTLHQLIRYANMNMVNVVVAELRFVCHWHLWKSDLNVV